MDKLIFSVIVGAVAGIVDIIPMIILKLPRYTTAAAFFHYFFVSIIIINCNIPHIPWWLEGGVIGLALMIPMLIHQGHEDKKPLPVITLNAIVLGTLVGIAGHYFAGV